MLKSKMAGMDVVAELTVLEEAEELESTNMPGAIAAYKQIIASADGEDLPSVKMTEQAIFKLANVYAKQGAAAEVADMINMLRPLFNVLAKAKTAKIVRMLIDVIATIPGTLEKQISLCMEVIDWCEKEQRTFLKQRIQTKLASLLLQKQDYQSAVPLLTELIREVKRLDDKQQLVEVHLIESALHFETKNANRSKAALTAARTAANAIYVPPGLQADIDVQAGTLLAQEKDFKTSYSYFVEAYEGYNTLEDKRAVSCVKYMLLAKIMLKQSDEVRGIMASKAAIKHAGTDLEAMKAVADANQARDLDAFDKATAKYDKELKGDPVIVAHLGDLYDNLLEQNLLRLIEPFSKVETTHIAKLIALDHSVVQEKLSQMILDKKLNGILDQGNGCLILHDPSDKDAVYEASIETVATLGSVVDNLYSKARKISA